MLVLKCQGQTKHTPKPDSDHLLLVLMDIKVFHLDGSFPALYNDLLMFSTYGLWGVIDSNCLLFFLTLLLLFLPNSHLVHMNTVLPELRVGSPTAASYGDAATKFASPEFNSIHFLKLKSSELSLFARPQTSTRPNVFLLSTIYIYSRDLECLTRIIFPYVL